MKLHNKGLCDVYCSLEGRVEKGSCITIGDRICAYRFCVDRSEGRRTSEDIVADGKEILKWISKKWNGEA